MKSSVIVKCVFVGWWKYFGDNAFDRMTISPYITSRMTILKVNLGQASHINKIRNIPTRDIFLCRKSLIPACIASYRYRSHLAV